MATLADVLIRLFKAQDIPCAVVEGWVLPNGQAPAIRGDLASSQSQGQYNCQTAFSIVNSFMIQTETHVISHIDQEEPQVCWFLGIIYLFESVWTPILPFLVPASWSGFLLR
ncbi:hypothetical protein HRE53_15445 [Acaryochloris sp. 'Moss Beach']|uniref:hypothetical protein n=1 Tax=Acaryochloris sp. 'Moss Beach' TaxID=2740837 RepID=UPI001F3590AE|nr:hypothetical protein [Acaryochloris sp. 'Moss Beach']UJB72207.1 hypothetical protein HRE53_15445 [Acaryochloris sp. 'Moss Beach']